jgi:glycosyltransferase involved in cell wall biosynthesis
MHVGVLAPDWEAQSGGAYTLENDLFNAIFTEGLASQHRFTALVNSRAKDKPVAYQTLDLAEASGGLLARAWRKSRNVLHASGERIGVVKASSRAHWFADVLAKNEIEFLICLNPYKTYIEQPFLVFVWDLEHAKQPFFPEVRGDEWRYRQEYFHQMLGRAAFVVTGSQVGAREIERIRVIPYPTPQFSLDSSLINAPAEPLPQLAAGTPFLFYPAQFWAHKNHVTALKVLKELRQCRQIDVKLVLVGSDCGNLAHVKRWVERLGLRNDVIYPGFVSRSQLVWLYQNALALLYPTLFGPENLPPLEAFALGCPVIASAIDGAAEQLGDAAALCQPMDVGGYADAAVRFLKDRPAREEIIRRGRARAAQWTRKDAAKALVGILDEFADVRANWGSV